MNSKLLMVREVWFFLRENRKLWLFPMVFVLLLIGAVLIFAESSVLAPFIYSLF